MKVYLATSGEYSDFAVLHAFTREEDAMAYELGDDVMEIELQEGPVEVRTWHTLIWWPDLGDREGDSTRLANPYVDSDRRDFNGRPKHAEHSWDDLRQGRRLMVGGWELERVQKVYSEQRAQHVARKDMGVES